MGAKFPKRKQVLVMKSGMRVEIKYPKSSSIVGQNVGISTSWQSSFFEVFSVDLEKTWNKEEKGKGVV